MSDAYDTGWDDGYNKGKEVGYEDGYSTGESYGYKDGFEAGKNEGIETGHESGKEEGEKETESKFEPIIQNLNDEIQNYRSTILWLKEEIRKLRIENATITRTISESTRDGNS